MEMINILMFSTTIILLLVMAYALIRNHQMKKLADGVHEELVRNKMENSQLTEALKNQSERREHLETLNSELDIRNRQLEEQVIKAQSKSEVLEKSLDSEKEWIENSKESLKATFKILAQDVFQVNSSHFLDLAKKAFESDRTISGKDLELRQKSIESLVAPLRSSLEKYEIEIKKLEVDRKTAYHHVEHELERMAQANTQLSKETVALTNALKRPHVRGQWGELQLKNCIEIAGMSEYADVSFQQEHLDEDEKKLIPDMTVKMPGGRVVIVDAKSPIDAFMSSLEAKDEVTRKLELNKHAKHVKEHIKKLSSRAYGPTLQNSADFTVMFLPNESFLYAALEAQNDIVEFALHRKILIVTPPTLIGLLKVVSFGWNEEKLARSAVEIAEVGKELHKRICDFTEAFVSIGRHLDKAKEEFSIGKSRLESRVLVQATRLEKLGAKSRKNISATLNPEDSHFESEELKAPEEPETEKPKESQKTSEIEA